MSGLGSNIKGQYYAMWKRLFKRQKKEKTQKEINVHILKTSPNQNLIEMLEWILEDVKKGEIQAAAIAMLYTDNRSNNAFVSKNRNPVTLLGEIEVMKRDIMDCDVDLRRVPMWEYCE